MMYKIKVNVEVEVEEKKPNSYSVIEALRIYGGKRLPFRGWLSGVNVLWEQRF